MKHRVGPEGRCPRVGESCLTQGCARLCRERSVLEKTTKKKKEKKKGTGELWVGTFPGEDRERTEERAPRSAGFPGPPRSSRAPTARRTPAPRVSGTPAACPPVLTILMLSLGTAPDPTLRDSVPQNCSPALVPPTSVLLLYK